MNLALVNLPGGEGTGEEGQAAQQSAGARGKHRCTGLGFVCCSLHDADSVATVV